MKKIKVNVYDLNSVAKVTMRPIKPKPIRRSYDVHSCGGVNSSTKMISAKKMDKESN